MLITEVHVEAFGKLKEEKFPLRAGLSVITGDNEIGKTTLAAFIKSVLFGLKEEEEEYRHYYPYDFQGAYGGSLKILLKTGLFYEVKRDFLTGALSVTKVSDGTPVEEPEAWLLEVLQGLTKEEYVKSGYISQNVFQYDAERYKNTIEKDELRKKEEAIRSDLMNAGKLLSEQREVYAARLDDTVLTRLKETEDRLAADTEELGEITKKLPEKEQQLFYAESGLANDRERVAEENAFREKKLLDAMLDDKRHLSEFVYVNERAADKKNTGGIVCLVFAVLVGLVAWFFRSSYGVEKDVDRWIFYGICGLAGIALVLGIVITIVIYAKRKKARLALENRDTYFNRLAYSERAYQNYMNGADGTHETVANEAERVTEIDGLKDELQAMKNRSEFLSQSNEEDTELQNVLAGAYEEQKAVRAELRALDIAIGAMNKLAGIEEDSEEALRSEAATDILLHMNDRRDSVISIENDIIFVTENGRRVLFSDLSTSSMQEVLFAVRLAILNELDAKKELPLILDESFANLDGERLQRVMKYVRTCGRQAILFSCQPREKKEMAK